MPEGTVKFFNSSKNYGFIEPEEEGEDLFFHISDVKSRAIAKGDRVKFEEEEGEKGPRAVNVRVL